MRHTPIKTVQINWLSLPRDELRVYSLQTRPQLLLPKDQKQLLHPGSYQYIASNDIGGITIPIWMRNRFQTWVLWITGCFDWAILQKSNSPSLKAKKFRFRGTQHRGGRIIPSSSTKAGPNGICESARHPRPCRFLLPMSMGGQESETRIHLSQIGRLARGLNRTLVLLNVGDSKIRACYKWNLSTYYV